MTPAISVIMAAYNGAALIGATLATLTRQTRGDFEVIVVDDCSTDDTREIVARWPDARVRLVSLARNGGPVRARNHALAQARGRFIAALDQDDLCHPDRFARQVAFLEANPHVALVGSAAEVLAENGALLRPRGPRTTSPALIGWLLRIGNPLVWSSVMLRADVARALDPFTRPEILYAEDFDLYQRVSRHGAVARIDDPLLIYRSHAGGASQRYEDTMLASAARVLAEANETTFGAASPQAARLFVRHLMHGEPVPDAATMRQLGTMLEMARRHHVAVTSPSEDDAALIARETRRRWAGVVRAGLRAGTIGVRDALAAGPILPAARIDQMAWNRMVGRVRRALPHQYSRDQIFAA